MDGEEMKRQFDHILKDGGGKRDFDVTPEEATKFKAAMADPEFQAMLRDYMEEMQDPAQRADQELYISELESQNRVPEGKEVVHPLPGFVIKTKFTRVAKDADSEKLFANVVTSDKMAKPYSKASGNRSGGETWSLPVAVGPLRMEKDKAGGSTTTFDVCYHPEALIRAQRLDAFRDLVALSSLERVEDAFLRGTEQKITVDKNYRILKGVKYKSGSCAVMMVAKGDISRVAEEGRTAAPVSAASEAKNDARNNPEKEVKSKATRSLPGNPSSASGGAGAAAEPKQAGKAQAPLPPGVKRGNGGTTYKLVESGAFELADHTEDRVRRTPTPQAIIATVTLPADAEPTRKLDVVVAPRRLTIGVLGDPEDGLRRYLDVRLPYEVEDDSKCSAARDKEGVLKITMPVKPPPPPSPPAAASAAAVAPASTESAAAAAASGGDGGGDGGVEEHKENLDGEEVKSDAAEAEQKSALNGKAQQPDHSRWVEDAPPPPPPPPAPPSAIEGSDKPEEPEEAPLPSSAQEENDGSVTEPPPPPLPPATSTPGVGASGAGATSRELPPPPPQPQQEEEEKEKKHQQEEQQQQQERELEERLAQSKDEEYIQCESFIRKVDGYEFKKGDKGCGYYRDDRGKKDPSIAWNENVKTVCGMVQVPNVVDSTVYYAFAEGERSNTNDNSSSTTMVLSFDAELPERSGGDGGGGGGGGVERYRTELILPGGIATSKCSHDTATENMVLKLVKAPVCEWGSSPVSRTTQVTEVASKIDAILDSAASAAAAAAARDDGSAKIAEEGPSAPRYEGSVPAKPSDKFNSIAFQIE